MTERSARSPGGEAVGAALVERRIIRAPVERVFAAWTEPAHLRRWWGPRAVTCIAAEIELCAGGRYALANRLADGRVIWIRGEFLEVQPPRRLVYTWRLDDPQAADERTQVTVTFEPRVNGTEVVVRHELVRSDVFGRRTQRGWRECLERLAAHCAGGRSG